MEQEQRAIWNVVEAEEVEDACILNKNECLQEEENLNVLHGEYKGREGPCYWYVTVNTVLVKFYRCYSEVLFPWRQHEAVLQ